MKTNFYVLAFASVLSLTAFAQTKPQDQKIVCDKATETVRKAADSCLKIKETKQRADCFTNLEKTVLSKVPDVCKQKMDPMKQEYINKEKSLYNGVSVLEGGGQGPQGQQPQMKPGQPMPMNGQTAQPANMPQGQQPQMKPGQPMPMNGQTAQPANMPQGQQPQMKPGQPMPMNGQTAQPANMPQGQQPQMKPGQPMNAGGAPAMTKAQEEACANLAKKLKPAGEACLKIKEQPKRSQCWDKLGSEVQKFQGGMCGEKLEPLKVSFQQAEKQLYPKQDPALK